MLRQKFTQFSISWMDVYHTLLADYLNGNFQIIDHITQMLHI